MAGSRQSSPELRRSILVYAKDLEKAHELAAESLRYDVRYAHLSPSHKAEAVERLASNFPTGFTTPAAKGIVSAS